MSVSLYPSTHRWLTTLVLLLGVSVGVSPDSYGATTGFKVLQADASVRDGVLRLDAEIDFGLSRAAQEALRNSVPLTLVLHMQIITRQGWLWDNVVADLEQRYQLKYHALAQQYVATNLNSGTLHSFPSRRAALRFIGRLREFPVIDQALLPTGGFGRVRAELDVESLPAPLRPVAYFSKSWRLSSDWYTWSYP